MIYKCPNCGYALTYDIGSKQMVCDACMSFFKPSEVENYAEGSKSEKELAASMDTKGGAGTQGDTLEGDRLEEENPREYMECNVYSCTSCGGELLVNGVETSTFCAYCGQPTIVFNRVSKELMPQFIIPFSVSKKEAEEAIRNKMKAGFFVPDEIKNFDVERLRGIYIPYWLCDMKYKDKQSLKGTVGSGKSRRTRYFYRAAECEYRNITMDASIRLSDESSQRLEPFDTTKLYPFNTSYMSGYFADRYDVDKKAIRDVAFKRGKRLFDEEVVKTVKASDVHIVNNKPQMDIKKLKYVLLPVWFLTFRYQDEPYTFLVNGQTKKVVGGVPYIKSFFWILVSILSLIATMLIHPVISTILTAASDSEDYVQMICVIATLGGVSMYAGIKNLKKLRKSIELSKSKTMLNFVKDRQGGE